MTNEIKFISLEQHFADLDKQRETLDKIDYLNVYADAHIKQMFLVGCDVLNADSECLLPITDPNYIHPTKAQLQCVVRYMIGKGVDKSEISKNLGLSTNGNRTLNYWLADSRDQTIPYTAWRLLLSLAGLSIDLMLLSERAEKIITEKAEAISKRETRP